MKQSDRVSRAVCTDTLTVSLRKTMGTLGLLSLWTVPVIGCVGGQPEACNLFIYYTWCFQNRALHKLRQDFNTKEPTSAAVQSSSIHPLLLLSLPEQERERSQLDLNQSKRKRKTEELWQVFTFSLWNHFKDRLAKIAAKDSLIRLK